MQRKFAFESCPKNVKDQEASRLLFGGCLNFEFVGVTQIIFSKGPTFLNNALKSVKNVGGWIIPVFEMNKIGFAGESNKFITWCSLRRKDRQT